MTIDDLLANIESLAAQMDLPPIRQKVLEIELLKLVSEYLADEKDANLRRAA